VHEAGKHPVAVFSITYSTGF